MSELLPCPFCGGKAHTIEPARYGKSWGVRCECGAFLGFEQTEAEAIAAWNTRAIHGTLTAEQVREVIFDCSAYARYDGAQYYANGINMQAIADELNSRAERTCECVAEYAKSPIDGKTIVLHRCSACHELMRPHMAYCPNCGARVIKSDQDLAQEVGE